MKASGVFHIDKEFLASDGNQILLLLLFLQIALFSIVSRDFWAGTSTLQSFPQRDPIKPESSLFPGNHCLGEEREDFNPNSKYRNPGRGDYHQSRSVKTKVESVSTKVEGLARDRSTTDSTYCPERLYTTVHLCTCSLVVCRVSINSLVSQCNIMLQHWALQTLQAKGISQRDAVQ